MSQITIEQIKNFKKSKKPIVALTCYDSASAAWIDPFVDIALVGDSLANTRLGYPHTLPITVDEMMHHVKASARSIKQALLVADLPFLSYETAPWQAAQTAGRFIKEGGAQAVKCEGGARIAGSITAMLRANIPVMGHLGLVPQSIHKMGGYKVQGRKPIDAQRIIKDAITLEKLGVFSIVLEGIPSQLAKTITKRLIIPTIGIGAGPHTDGQILVLDDILGLTEHGLPKFVKRFANLAPLVRKAISDYRNEVTQKRFPNTAHSY